MKAKLSHVRPDGSVSMVDVGAKRATQREASAQAIVRMNAAAHRALKSGDLKKGDALATARIAGIMAAKKTASLIPLCHPLALTYIDVDIVLRGSNTATVTCSARCTGPTGVEMEAMTGACVAALTIYDMCKALDRGIVIESVKLLAKSGGRSGAYRA
ncbi:MAG TPA: cyclic pyranopterin monophosphate synthase MoaC [Candidatus Eremiobacteraceae bacterium]|nr:cyclic pyranopterin monophosphate synthase MoaC [Candidatus Eremiobacteraceae bacterium]